MAGHWQGEMFGGMAEEVWNPPSGNSMMGMYKLIKDGKTVFYEFFSIIEESNSLILKLKHFNPDMTGWEEKGYGTIGFRVINSSGSIIYDGKVSFKGTGPFEVVNTLISGPFINLLTSEGATISFETSKVSVCEILVDGKSFRSGDSTKKHEIKVDGLAPGRCGRPLLA